MSETTPKPHEMAIAINGDIKTGGSIILNFEKVGEELSLWFRLGSVIEVTIPASEVKQLREWLTHNK